MYAMVQVTGRKGNENMSEIIEFLITNLISLGASSLESPSKNGCYQEDVRKLKQ
jgi:hypothetical protein